MFAHFGSFLVRLAVSSVVLMLSVGWVTPRNPLNTFGRAVLVSFLLSLAWYVTLAKFLWFFLVPLLAYMLVWLVTVMVAYGLGPGTALLLAVALSFLSWLVGFLFRISSW